MNKRILFVDDEPNVLQGLRRMLRAQRGDWEMTFVDSGPQALSLLQAHDFDVIVSDMRMPGMDGAELLEKAMNTQPSIMRVVLSGHVDQEMSVRTVGPTHQYLAKPCDGEQLKGALSRAFVLQNLIANNEVRALVASMKSLPSLPSIYLKLVDLVARPDCSMKDVGELVAQDPAMTLRILQLVNSAFFGIGRPVSDPGQAAGLLGLDLIKSLVLTVGLFSQFDGQVKTATMNKHWTHSTTVGALAKRIARAENAAKSTCESSQLAGMLKELGVLILACNFSEKYASVHQLAASEQLSITGAEQEILGCTHAQVGAYLTGLWGLPDSVIDAIAFHHQPLASISAEDFGALSCVHVADALCYEEQYSGAQRPLDIEYLKSIGKANRVDEWQDLARETMGQTAQ